MQRQKRTKREALEALWQMVADMMPEESEEEIDEYLRECGYDPDEVVARLQARIKPILERMRRENEHAGRD